MKKALRILHISYSDTSGGAARAAYRLHLGLQVRAVCSNMLVCQKSSDSKSVISPATKWQKLYAQIGPKAERFLKWAYAGRSPSLFSPANIPGAHIAALLTKIPADIVNLHWTCGGMLRIEDLIKIRKPIVWTLHDMWAFTGGCHYAGECTKYQQFCGNCPLLSKSGDEDLSHHTLNRKIQSFKHLNVTVAAPSHWLGECARKSTLFRDKRIKVIHNGLDLTIFKPTDKRLARKTFDLPDHKMLILFGAVGAINDPRKGFDLLLSGLERLPGKWAQQVDLAVFGSANPGVSQYHGFKVHFLGEIHDDHRLALLYSAANLMIVPSRQDNLPNTVLESLASGTPVVAFNIGGMPDMIGHNESGYLANPFDAKDLADGIEMILNRQNQNDEMSTAARSRAEEKFSVEKMAKGYTALYESLL